MSMGNTYMSGEYQFPLETKEWTQVWLDEAMDTKTPRVLLVGDSIFNGITRNIINMVDGTVLFDGFCSSKAVDNPYLIEELELFMKQQGHRKVIIFNNGLHGWHLEDETTYAKGYDAILSCLKEKFPNTPIIVSLTTAIKDEHLPRVLVRNKVARQLAEKHQCPVMDLFTESQKHEQLMIDDGIHFQEIGYQKMCEYIMGYVKEFEKSSR